MASVLFVSKPIAPPWNDSGKNLVKDLALSLTRHSACVMTRQGEDPPGDGVDAWPVYPAAAGGFAPALTDQARVMTALLRDRDHALWHFFFAPNPKSCLAGAVARRLRGRPTVHTVSSSPRDPQAIVSKLFADVHVVLSRHTERGLLEAGLAAQRLTRISPAIVPLKAPSEAQRQKARADLGLPAAAPIVVYPGDLEFGEGGPLCVRALAHLGRRDVVLVMACRAKTAAARTAEARLRAETDALGLTDQVVWLGETPKIHALLGAADLVALPSQDLYAKMDYPLVVLEAMSMARPSLVAAGSAAAELGDTGGALVVQPDVEAVADAVTRCLDDAERSRALGEAGARLVRERYSPEVMARAYEALYDRLC